MSITKRDQQELDPIVLFALRKSSGAAWMLDTTNTVGLIARSEEEWIEGMRTESAIGSHERI